MKKLLLLCILFVCNILYSQEYIVTPEGMRNKENPQSTSVTLIFNQSADELYRKTERYFKNKNQAHSADYSNQKIIHEVSHSGMKVKNSGTNIPVTLKYIEDISIQENKVVYNLVSVEMPGPNGYNAEFSGNIWKSYPIYNQKNGELRLSETKDYLEKYFNAELQEYKRFLETESSVDPAPANVCDMLVKKVDKFNDNEITWYTPFEKPLGFTKNKDGIYMNFEVSSSTPLHLQKGAYVLFSDGTKISKPEADIKLDIRNGVYYNKVFFRLSSEDIKMLTSKHITDFRVCVADASTLEGPMYQELIKCLIVK